MCIRDSYNTVFYFNIVVSIVLYISLFLASPAISVFFKEPILMEVMRFFTENLIQYRYVPVRRADIRCV